MTKKFKGLIKKLFLRRGRNVWLVSGGNGPCRLKGVIKMPCFEVAITTTRD